MKYTLIKGNFYVVGYSPDGDSVKFKAKSKVRWNKIVTDHQETFAERLAEEDGVVMLRLQGIDALETHYTPKTLSTPKELKQKDTRNLKQPSPGDHKQPVALARQATEEFMRLLGISRMEWRSWGKHTWIDKIYIERRGKEICIEEKHADKIPGYILTRDVDSKGRPIAWVFSGSAPERDGSQLTQEKLLRRIEQSANYQLLKRGLVYPYFFMTLPGKLRDKLAEAAQQAQAEATRQTPSASQSQQRQPNIWLYDKTVQGVSITDLSKITDRYEIYPYLFRKIIKHWYRKNMEKYWAALNHNSDYQENGHRVSLKGFFDGGNPYIFIVSERDFVRLDEVVEIKRNRLKMSKYPFDIVFLS